MRCSRMLLVVAVLLGSLTFASTSATTIHIPADYPTLTEGLTQVDQGDTLLVAPGLYLEHDLVIPSGICLRGSTGDPADVVIDAQQMGRVMACIDLAELVRIEALTISGGLVNSDITDWPKGGGIYIEASSVTVGNCRIVGNEAEIEGGGIACHTGADVTITGCLISGNSSIDGAGVGCNTTSPLLENCIITGNEGLFWGGALFCRHGSNARIINCTLVGNEAHSGSGIWALDCPDIQIENSIIAYGIEGEGVHAYDNFNYPSEITLSCCNVFGNEGGDYGGTTEDQTGFEGNISDNPGFCDLENSDFSLSTPSPCLPQNNSCGELMGALGQGCDFNVGVEDDDAQVPDPTRLKQNQPNPFNPRTVITFELTQAGAVTLAVYDLRGNLIRHLIAGESMPGGIHHSTWDGCGDDGRQQPSGIFLCRLTTVDGTQTRKMTLAR